MVNFVTWQFPFYHIAKNTRGQHELSNKIQLIYWHHIQQLKKLLFNIEAIIGYRHDSPNSLAQNEIQQWLFNMQKQDILKAETETEYWEDVPEKIFELFQTNIKNKNYEQTMAKGHLWLKMEIPLETETEEK